MKSRDPRYQWLQGPAQVAASQKQRLLSEGGGGYVPIPHAVYRTHLRDLIAKYDGKTARDALTIYMYLHAYVNGTESNDWYMWAFPNVEQIREDTGIHGDRIAPLVRILESEGLIITKMIPWMGNAKKMYLPFYYPIMDDSRSREATES